MIDLIDKVVTGEDPDRHDRVEWLQDYVNQKEEDREYTGRDPPSPRTVERKLQNSFGVSSSTAKRDVRCALMLRLVDISEGCVVPTGMDLDEALTILGEEE